MYWLLHLIDRAGVAVVVEIRLAIVIAAAKCCAVVQDWNR